MKESKDMCLGTGDYRSFVVTVVLKGLGIIWACRCVEGTRLARVLVSKDITAALATERRVRYGNFFDLREWEVGIHR